MSLAGRKGEEKGRVKQGVRREEGQETGRRGAKGGKKGYSEAGQETGRRGQRKGRRAIAKQDRRQGEGREGRLWRSKATKRLQEVVEVFSLRAFQDARMMRDRRLSLGLLELPGGAGVSREAWGTNWHVQGDSGVRKTQQLTTTFGKFHQDWKS